MAVQVLWREQVPRRGFSFAAQLKKADFFFFIQLKPFMSLYKTAADAAR